MDFSRKMLLTAAIVLGWNICVFAADMQLSEAVGKTVYTRANIWYEIKTGSLPVVIYSTNYHKGTMIPRGSKVKITRYDSRGIYFTDEKMKLDFYIEIVAKHTRESAPELFKLYFSANDPMAFGGEFGRFDGKEKENIKSGTVSEGMRKNAVLAAYGYPPSHMTPSLEANMWTYWENRFRKIVVTFSGDRVASIVR